MSEKEIVRGFDANELRIASGVVERAMRMIGKDCEIVTYDTGVQVACLAWPGDISELTLGDALVQALRETD